MKLLTDCAHLLQLFEWSGPELVGKIKGGNLYHGDPKAPHVRPAHPWRKHSFSPVFRTRSIRKFFGLPDPDTLVRGTYPDPSIIKKNSKKTLISTVL